MQSVNIIARGYGSPRPVRNCALGGDDGAEDPRYNRLIAAISLPAALIRAMASVVFSIAVAM